MVHMNMHMFGHRCLVERKTMKTNSSLFIPEAAEKNTHDTHRTGVVRFVGDGRKRGTAEAKEPLVKEGDMVLFQINQIMEATQTYSHEGKACMNLLQEELIARIVGDDMDVTNLEMLGDYVLLKHFTRKQPGSLLILPDNATRQSASEYIYFKLVKKGINVDLPITEGDELVVNYGRLTPIFIMRRDASGGSHYDEYCYTRKDWIDGVVTPDDASKA